MKAGMNDTGHPQDIEEVMRFDPEDAIVDLDAHLERLTDAAEAQGYQFDSHGARNELQAATFGRRMPGRVRLVLSPTGAMAIEIRAIH